MISGNFIFSRIVYFFIFLFCTIGFLCYDRRVGFELSSTEIEGADYMISVKNKEFLFTPIADYIISAEKVVHVQIGNNAEHALLVLTKTGYSSIPVLDANDRLKGLLSIRTVTDSILGLAHIEYERLPYLKVDEIMKTDFPTIRTTDRIQRGLDMVIDNPFVCVVEEDGTFAGILTRRVILKQFKKYIYSVD